jgi:hypothetical protein
MKKCKAKKCCCKCDNHYPLYCHPCADGQPMSKKDGYVCVGLAYEGRVIKMSEHGECELFTQVQKNWKRL